jgi:hypothetical protein
VTDGGTNWQPPGAGGSTPPPPPSTPGGFAPPGPGATPPPDGGSPTAPVEGASPQPGRSRGKVVAAAVGALAIVGAGVFAVTRISGDGAASGGADSPEAAAELLLDALDAEDVLGAVEVLLPGERETFREPMQRFVTRLADWDVLSDDNLSGIGGIDIMVSDRDVRVEETNVEDIVNLSVSATVASKVDGAALPIGDWLRDQVGEEQIGELDTETDPEDGTFPVTAVRQDGRWYLSLFYTAAEQARAETGAEIPAEGIEPRGGDTPEAAMDNFLGALADVDLTGMVATLNPNEFAALQRYAPLFVDDAQRDVDDGLRQSGVSIELGDTSYDVTGSGSQRSVAITGFAVEISAEGETLSLRLEDGCVVGEVPGQAEELNSCTLREQLEEQVDLEDVVEDPQVVEDAIADIEAAFEDYENPGILVQQVDGAWYLSPMATWSDQVLAVMEALSRDEIENLATKFEDLAAVFEEQVNNSGIDVPEFDDFELPDDGFGLPEDDSDVVVTVPTDDTIGDTGSDEESAPASTYVDEQCYDLDVAGAATCYQELVAGGQMEADLVPWFLRFPECGAGEALWDGSYYSLPDEEFVAFVDSLQPCVQGLVESGEVRLIELAEIGMPECLDGRNPWLLDPDSPEFEAFDQCVYD